MDQMFWVNFILFGCAIRDDGDEDDVPSSIWNLCFASLLFVHKPPFKRDFYSETRGATETTNIFVHTQFPTVCMGSSFVRKQRQLDERSASLQANKAEIHAGCLLMVLAMTDGQGEASSSMASIVAWKCRLSHPPRVSSAWTRHSCRHPPATALRRVLKALLHRDALFSVFTFSMFPSQIQTERFDQTSQKHFTNRNSCIVRFCQPLNTSPFNHQF